MSLRTPTQTRMNRCFRTPCWGSFLAPTVLFSDAFLHPVVYLEEVISGNASLCQDGSQCGAFDGRVIQHCQRCRSAIGIHAFHGDMIPFSHKAKTQYPERFYDSPVRRIDRKLGHQAGTLASEMNASRMGGFTSSCSIPKVSRWNSSADSRSATAASKLSP